VLDVKVKETAEAARLLSGTMDVTVDGKTVDRTLTLTRTRTRTGTRTRTRPES
jgi:hypothetical protein